MTEFEVVDFTPPTTFGWVERGERNGWKTFFRLDPTAESTAVTVRDVWAPRSLVAWLRGRLFEKRRVRSEEHTSELQSQSNLVCRLLLEKKKTVDGGCIIANQDAQKPKRHQCL